MTIFNEMFRVRKDIQTLKQRLTFLNEESQTSGSIKIHNEIEEVTEKLEHLKLRMQILENLSNDYHQ